MSYYEVYLDLKFRKGNGEEYTRPITCKFDEENSRKIFEILNGRDYDLVWRPESEDFDIKTEMENLYAFLVNQKAYYSGMNWWKDTFIEEEYNRSSPSPMGADDADIVYETLQQSSFEPSFGKTLENVERGNPAAIYKASILNKNRKSVILYFTEEANNEFKIRRNLMTSEVKKIEGAMSELNNFLLQKGISLNGVAFDSQEQLQNDPYADKSYIDLE